MPVSAVIGAVLGDMMKNAAYDVLKAGVKHPESLVLALQKAAEQAAEDFYEKHGDQFGTNQTSFLARNENWERIFQSLFFSSDNIFADAINPKTYDETKVDATSEAVEYFLQRLQQRITEDETLDYHFVEKHHVKEQTEVKTEIIQQGERLLKVDAAVDRVERRQEEFYRSLESRFQSFNVTDIQREKDAVNSTINDQIDLANDFINGKNQPLAAITILENLKAKKWDELPNRLRFRIATNIASAKLRIYKDQSAAAQELLEAAKILPDDRKAIVNSAIAHWILGNLAAAREKAEKAVTKFPDDAECYHVLLITLTHDEQCADPLPRIPSELLSSPLVCRGLADFFHHKGNETESKKWCKRAYELCDNDRDIQEAYATMLLEELGSQGSVIIGYQFTPSQRQQAEESRDILAAIWAQAKDKEVSWRYIPCVVNLSNAERLLGNVVNALGHIEDALRRHPDNFMLKKQQCFCLLDNGKVTEALEVLRGLPDNAFEEKVPLEAEILANLNKTDDALQKLEQFFSQTESADNVLTVVASSIRVQLYKKLQGNDVALPLALDLANTYPDKTEYLLLVSEIYADKAAKDQAIEWANKAKNVAIATGSYTEQSRAADNLFKLGLHREAATLFQKLVTTYEDSMNLRQLLACYLAGDYRKEAFDLIQCIPEHVKELRFYSRACAELFYRVGNRDEARKYLEYCTKATPEDLEIQLNYMLLLERMGQKEDVRKVLGKLPDIKDATPEAFAKLSHLYARYKMREKALKLGYQTLKKYDCVAAAHLGYCSLLLSAVKKVPEIDDVTEQQKVAVDTAFTYRTQSGKSLTFIIEPEVTDHSREISLENPVAVKTLGLKVGDTFVVAESPVGTEEATIVEVKHKYLYALHESMNNFQYRFPDVPGMWMFSLTPTKDGGVDLQPIFDMISKRSDAVMNTEQIYAAHPVPLALVAKNLGHHPIDCLLGMSFGGRVKIKCCNGDLVEREKAIKAVLAEQSRFIIDPFSIFTFYHLQALDALLRIANGKLGITQSTLDFFRELIETRKESGGGFMTLAKENGEFFKNEFSKEDVLISVIPFENIIKWCEENCEIVPAAGKVDLEFKERQLFADLHPVFLDTLLAANGTGRLLISEDLHYRQVAKLFLEIEGVWAQPLLVAGVLTKILTKDQYHEAIGSLIAMNYNFVSISADDLLFHAKKDNFNAGAGFIRLMQTTSAATTDINTTIWVAANFLCLLFEETGTFSQIEKITYATLNYLTLNPNKTVRQIIARLNIELARRLILIETLPKDDYILLRQCIAWWCFGHFIYASDSTTEKQSIGKGPIKQISAQ